MNMIMEYKWIKNNDAPFDIWLQETEIESMKEIIAIGDFMEYWLFYGNTKATGGERNAERHKYVTEHRDGISIERVLSFCAAGFGNKPERTITIMREGEMIERWERTIIPPASEEIEPK